MSQRLLRRNNHPNDHMEESLLQPRNGQRVGYGSVLLSEEEEEIDLRHIDAEATTATADVEAVATTSSSAAVDQTDAAVIRFKRPHPKSKHRKSAASSHLSEGARDSLTTSNSLPSRSHSKCSGTGGEEDSAKKRTRWKSALIWFYSGGRKILVKYWIWMVALMLMLMSVSGNRVVVFRIFYMILFLAFLLTFQVSH